MAYATQSDLVPLRMTQSDLAELTVDVPSGDSATDAATTASVTASALEEASGRIDSYCRGRYLTPLQMSDVVVALTIDIAVYLLFSRRRDARPKEIVRQRYEDAMKLLKDISLGNASLDQPASQQTAQSSAAGPQISERDRRLTFSKCNLEGFV